MRGRKGWKDKKADREDWGKRWREIYMGSKFYRIVICVSLRGRKTYLSGRGISRTLGK